MAGLDKMTRQILEEAKAAADFVTLANTENGIVYALKKYIPELA